MAAVWFIVTIPSAVGEGKVVASNEYLLLPSETSRSNVSYDKGGASQPRASEIESHFYGPKDSQNNVDLPLEKVLKKKLDELSIKDAVWSLSQNEQHYQISFPVVRNACEEILSSLSSVGIGSRPQTTLSVLPCTIHYNTFDGDNALDDGESEIDDREKSGEGIPPFKGSRNSFIQSIKSRLTVAQVVEGVRGSASLTFDFIMFILLAGALAALGLVENSSVVLVASMLVSPMMGPILAGTFGTVIQDRDLQRIGVKNELIGLGLCLSFGFVFGLVYGSVEHWSEGFWLTDEMVARGQLRSLWVGALIALPSGAGVALSVLGGNAGSLVGVAISASLLPPVVNGGLLWAVALTKYIKSQIHGSSSYLDAPENYVPSYSNNMAIEACGLGAVSITLTIVNIICIFIMGVIFLKIKEVAPQSAVTTRFWHEDIRETRNHNMTLSRADGKEMSEKLMQELGRGLETDEEIGVTMRNKDRYDLFSILDTVKNDPVYRTVRCHSAFPHTGLLNYPTWYGNERETNRTSLNELKANHRRMLRFQRSISSPQGQSGDVAAKANRSTSPKGDAVDPEAASPTHKIHFNVPRFGHRFTVTQAEEDPLPPSRRATKHKSYKKEKDRHLAEIHELVP